MDESSKVEENSEIEERVCSSESEDFSTSNLIKEALKDLPEALNFIHRLQDCILKQQTLIHKLYAKLKDESVQKESLPALTKDESTQTSEDDLNLKKRKKKLKKDPLTDLKAEDLVTDIKRAAENAVKKSGFVYEATSGMYYDYNTGFYYNAELGLYYDGNTGVYYYYDESSQSFQFHSQVPLVPQLTSSAENEPNWPDISSTKRKDDTIITEEEIPKKIKLEIKEEGECSDSSREDESEKQDLAKESEPTPSTCDNNIDSVKSEDSKPDLHIVQNILAIDELADAWPPCLRLVVKETKVENLLVGTLFIVTCTGGTMGREGDHAVTIPDINISKYHAKISFSEEKKCYTIVDLGSRNGTYVNEKRISVALKESEPVVLRNSHKINVGTTQFVCHIHRGRDTCRGCEPGCALIKPTENSESTKKEYEAEEAKEAKHRSELRKLRKRFGLDKLSAKESVPSLGDGYKDRAEERRKTVGSQDHNEKTETASVHHSIKKTNKGFKMLSKMGWTEGESLGKISSKGITEPVTVEQRAEKAGLGSDLVHLTATDPKSKKKAEVWKKAQKRFQDLDEQ